MKKINYISTWFMAGMLFCAFATQAQGIHGKASVTVEKLNEKPVIYNFPDDFPNTTLTCEQTGNKGDKFGYMDIDFSKSFKQYPNADGAAPIVTVHIRIGPSGAGTFPLKPADSNHPYGTLSMDLNTPAKPLNDFDPGANGEITISTYPSVGGFVVGSFKATLKDIAGNTYLVHGTFRIVRQSDSH